MISLYKNWQEMCGPSGFTVWSEAHKDIGLCFQGLCLQIPVLCLLAMVSAYYCGIHSNWVVRTRTQMRVIYSRIIVTILMALVPAVYLTLILVLQAKGFYVVHYLLSGMQCFVWVIHLCYIIALKTRLCDSPRGPTIVCMLWIFNFIFQCISLRSHVLQYDDDSLSLRMGYAFSIVSITLQCLYLVSLIPNVDGRVSSYEELSHTITPMVSEQQPLLCSRTNIYSRFCEERDPHYLGIAKEGVTLLSKLVFYWVNPLMDKGVKGKLQDPDDLYDLPLDLSSSQSCAKLEEAMNLSPCGQLSEESGMVSPVEEVAIRGRGQPVSLVRALHKCYGWQFYSIGILKFIGDCAGFMGPILLNKLVTFIETKSEAIMDGYMYSAGLFAVSLIGAFCNSHFSFLMAEVGLKIRASVIAVVYRKTLTLSATTLSQFTVGEIVNFMSTDTDRIVNACPSFHAFWSIPFQIAVALYLLYEQVGLAFLAGVGFSIVLIPINKVIASKIGTLSTKLMERKDHRVKVMTEILYGIRVLKLHVWEDHFVRKIGKLRELELKYLKGRKYLDALCVYFWATTPVLISILTFTTYSLLGNKLTAARVFTSIALLNMLIFPLNTFPWVLNGLIEAWVSVKRVQRLLELPDMDLSKYYTAMPLKESSLEIFFKSGLFSWGRPGGGSASNAEKTDASVQPEHYEFKLRNVEFHVQKGQFIGVIGQVGCGKSTLLSAVLAEVGKEAGVVCVSETDSGFGFVTQQPWIQRGTLRDNILFGKNYDHNKYMAILDACCLDEDIKALPGGDLTSVGESGVTLSGGQKARVALARAVYQDKSIYLLDDVLSAVDVHVARTLFQKCIIGLLRNKTRILCTHHVQYLLSADWILVLEDGKITSQGPPNDILTDFEDYDSANLDSIQTVDEGEVVESKSEEPLETTSITEEEEREVGSIRLFVYKSYWKAIGHLLGISILLSMFLMQSSRNLTDWWLSYWVTHSRTNFTNGTHAVLVDQSIDNDRSVDRNFDSEGLEFSQFVDMPTPSDEVTYYLTVYGVIAALNSIFTLFRAFLFAYGGIHAATNIHRLLLKKIIKAQVSFFDVSPVGRILNRFSSDTYTIDDSLPFIMNILMAQLFSVLGSIIITIYGLPWLCLVLIPLIPIYNWLQKYYRLTSRELKRLSSTTLSPIYSHFNETLLGLSTIRAFRATQRFKRENEDKLESNQKTQYASQAAAQWLSLRLQFIGVAMVTGVGVIAVIQHQFDVANPGLVGLAISYALSITGLLSGVVNAFTETEKEMIAVERAYQYIDHVPPEKSIEVMAPPYAWPSQGVVTFHEVVLQYREHLSPSLRGVSFQTRPAEKVGIVGRTGAGKSSLFTAFFRLNELTRGEILIDTVNIAHISLRGLRSRIAIIPQDPFLFSGTVRENLDPLGQYADPELWGALQRCHLSAVVRRNGGLNAEVGERGQLLSIGQRQLLCLSRAVLHNAKILCIDEATANVDQETDRHIQRTIRSSFRQSTVLTIAHRIQTVMDSDRVLVMGDGEVLEFESPDVLLQQKESYFYKLASQEFQ